LHVVVLPLLAQVPPLAETVPLPLTVSVSGTGVDPGAVAVPKLAVTDRAAVIVTTHVLVPLQAPPQAVKLAPPLGVAVKVAVVPLARLTLQTVWPSPQSIPLPVTCPAPVTETVSG
jgi:hypothetical protein